MTSRLKSSSEEDTHTIVDPEEARLTEFEAGVIRGIEEYRAGKGTACHTSGEALEHLKACRD